ncbi:hypothetical protein [Nostoc sp. NZL]|nr:hypothetical protein [Nostoc sp. NZL]
MALNYPQLWWLPTIVILVVNSTALTLGGAGPTSARPLHHAVLVELVTNF